MNNKVLSGKSAKKNQSVEKVFLIIEEMAKHGQPIRLQDLAQKLKQPASTVLRFLNTLSSFQYVYQDPNSLKYSLSLKFCQIGEMVRSQVSISDIARPFLRELSEKSGESTCLAIDQEQEVVYIDVVEGPGNVLKAMQRIGKRAPLHCTGVGKLLLLNFDNIKLDFYIHEKHLFPLTPHSITTKQKLLEELKQIKEQGYALDNEECEIGARCIAAPIRNFNQRIVACISITGPISRMTDEKIGHLKNFIVETAENISVKLGYTNKSS